MESDYKKDTLKTGTTTVGIVCKDGIVLAADRRTTAGHQIANKKTQKVIPICDYAAITTAGLVSDAQLFTKLIKAEIKLKEIRVSRSLLLKEVANMLASLSYSNIRQFSSIPGIVGFLVGGVDNDGFWLYEIGYDGSIQAHDTFTADGSGSVFALGTLEILYKKGMTVDEASKIAVKAVNTAMQHDNTS